MIFVIADDIVIKTTYASMLSDELFVIYCLISRYVNLYDYLQLFFTSKATAYNQPLNKLLYLGICETAKHKRRTELLLFSLMPNKKTFEERIFVEDKLIGTIWATLSSLDMQISYKCFLPLDPKLADKDALIIEDRIMSVIELYIMMPAVFCRAGRLVFQWFHQNVREKIHHMDAAKRDLKKIYHQLLPIKAVI